MGKRKNLARVGAASVGIGALAAAIILPGSIAVAQGDIVTTDVTRAVLIQANANGDISRTTLVTQINVDGDGQAQFSVPVAPGGSPVNMDSFGRPSIVDGNAQYDLSVSGATSFRTSQSFDKADIPVTLSVEATLDGQPIELSNLAGKTGLVKLTYTLVNNTSEPTELTFTDALGKSHTETREIPVPMGGSVNITFPPSWGDLSAPQASVVSGDGSGNTLVSGTVAMLPETLPNQSTTAKFEIESRVTNAVVPPADIKVAVLNPATTPDLQAGRTTAEEGEGTAGSITDAGVQIADGAGQLATGLTKASDGANALSDGLITFYDSGIGELRSQAANLRDTVVGKPEFKELTDGFDGVRDATAGVRDALGVYSNRGPGQFLKANGDVNTARTTVARTLWSLVYGVRSADIPSGSATRTPNEDTAGLTNPSCDMDNPKDPTNPCGAWQVADAISDGLETAAAALSDSGDFALNSLAKALGCETSKPGGYTGHVVDPVTGLNGNPCGKSIYVVPEGTPVGNITAADSFCANPLYVPGGEGAAGLPSLPCNMVVNALLGGVDFMGAEMGGLTQALFRPFNDQDTSDSGLVSLMGGFFPAAIGEILANVTSDPNGRPDLDTSNGNTATGVLMQARAALARGGIGSDGYPGGRCEGYRRAGDPSSGMNPNLDADRVSQTCAAADVLNVSLMGLGKIEEGVSTTLLNNISATLVEGIGTYSSGCEPTSSLSCAAGTLRNGGEQLAEGLPAAVKGAGQLQTDGGDALRDTGNKASRTAGLALATFDALQTRVDSGAGIPGGSPQGVTTFGGVYAFQLAGSGGLNADNGVRIALALLALIGAAGAGVALSRRKA